MLKKEQLEAMKNKTFKEMLDKEKEQVNDNEDSDSGDNDEEDAKNEDDGGNDNKDEDSKNTVSIDFKKLLKNTKSVKTLELPFTNTQVEDVMFLNKRYVEIEEKDQDGNCIKENNQKKMKREIVQEIVALQCNFYMSDCYYYDLVDNPNPVNRMGSENYDVSDWNDFNKKLPYGKKPQKNLVIDKTKSYIHKNQAEQMMPTENREAKVEYYLTKWLVNSKGGMKMTMQSPMFKMDGTFKEHCEDNMELQLNEDGKFLFIIQNDS